MRRWRGSGCRRWARRKPAPQPQLDRFQPLPEPHLVDTFPEDSPHLAKARLLANAGLNEYIAQEIKADPNSSSWSALAEAQIYSSYGETFRAVRALKRALPELGFRVHSVDSAGLLANPVSRGRGGIRSRPSRPGTISIHIWWPRSFGRSRSSIPPRSPMPTPMA